MGYRMKPWSEEMPPQLQYIADPNIQAQYRALGEEAYARSQQTEQMKNQMASETIAIKERGDQGLRDGIKEGVNAYKQGNERAADRQMKNAQFEREGRVSEEQMAASQQQRELAGQEGQRQAELAPLAKRELESRTSGAEADTKGKLSDRAFADAVSTQKDADGVETNAMYGRRKTLERDGFDSDTARLKVQNETQSLAQSKELFPLQKRQAESGIRASDAGIAASQAQTAMAQKQTAEMDRAQRVKGATFRFQAELASPEGDPAKKQARIQALAQEMRDAGAKAEDISEAIVTSKSNNQQQMTAAALVDNALNPEKAMEKNYNAQRFVEGKQKVDMAINAIAEMNTESQRYKRSASVKDTQGTSSVNRIKQMMTDAGYQDLADDIDNSTGGFAGVVPKWAGGGGEIYPGGGEFFGRQQKIDKAIATFKERELNKANALSKTDQRFTSYAGQLAAVRVGGPTPQEVAAGYVPLQMGAPQQSTVGGPQQSTVGSLQGMPGVKIRPQVGSK